MLSIFGTKLLAILQILEYIVYASEFSPCILFLILLKSIKTKDYKVLFLYECCLAITLALILYFISIKAKPGNLLFVQRIFPLIECPLLCYFYYLSLKRSNTKKVILLFGAFFLCGVFLYDLLTNKQKPSFLPLSLEGFFFTLVILYYFYEKVKYINDIPIYSIATFWISIAFLLNFSGTFFLYLFSYTMSKEPSFQDQYHIIYAAFTISKNILLCTGIFVNRNAIVSQKTTFIEPDLDFERFYPLKKSKP